MIGRVVSIKSNKTASVLVERTAMDSLYKKKYLQSKKYLVDTAIEVKMGDIVEFINCKPISKRKAFKVIKILGKNLTKIAEAELKKGAEAIIAEVMPEENKEGEVKQLNSELENKKEEKIKPKTKRRENLVN